MLLCLKSLYFTLNMGFYALLKMKCYEKWIQKKQLYIKVYQFDRSIYCITDRQPNFYYKSQVSLKASVCSDIYNDADNYHTDKENNASGGKNCRGNREPLSLVENESDDAKS